MATRATEKPLRRVLQARHYQYEEMIVELTTDRITLRPLGTRKGGAQEKTITPGALHDYIATRDAGVVAPRKARRKVSRGFKV